MLVTTLYLAAAAEGAADPYRVLGSNADERLALAALADLTLARVLQGLPTREDESDDARGLAIVGAPPAGVLTAAVELLRRAKQPLDIDRARRALRDLLPAVEAELLASGSLTEGTAKGLFKKKAVLTARPEMAAAAQAELRSAAGGRTAGDRALVLIAVSGLSKRRLEQLAGGSLAPAFGVFEDVDPALLAPDGQQIGPEGADLLGSLTTVALGLSDSSEFLND